MVSLNESKLSSVICADSGSELNMKKKLNLEENRPTLAGYGQGHYDSLGEACPPVQQTEAELCPARRVGTTGLAEAKDEVALELTSLLPAEHCESIRNTRCLSVPYQSHHHTAGSNISRWRTVGFLQKLVSDYNKGDHGSSLRAMEGRPRGDHSSRSGSLTVCPNRFLEGTESRTMLEMEWFCYFNKDGHSRTESCGILSLSS